MKLEALPTLLTHRRLQSFVTQTRVSLDSTRVEAVTGLTADRAAKVGGNIGHIRKLEKLLADNESHLAAVAQFKADASVVQLSLDQTRQTLSQLQFDIEGATALQNEEGVKAASAVARAELEALWGRLNSTHAGRYLFSGAKTDTAPLGSLDDMLADVKSRLVGPAGSTIDSAMDLYFDDPDGVFQTTIYQGSIDTNAPTREVEENRRVGIEVKAIDDSVRETIRALTSIALAHETIGDPELRNDFLNLAAGHAGAASTALTEEQTKLGAREADAALLEARHNGSNQTLQTELSELLGVDQYEAASRMNELETQLEAAYLTTSRIQQLSLLNYLR